MTTKIRIPQSKAKIEAKRSLKRQISIGNTTFLRGYPIIEPFFLHLFDVMTSSVFWPHFGFSARLKTLPFLGVRGAFHTRTPLSNGVHGQMVQITLRMAFATNRSKQP